MTKRFLGEKLLRPGEIELEQITLNIQDPEVRESIRQSHNPTLLGLLQPNSEEVEALLIRKYLGIEHNK